jgi:hypothetical protein
MRPSGSYRSLRYLIAAAVALSIGSSPARPDSDQEVRVTVIAVLASSKHKEICPKLKCLAEKMQEQDPTFTGFRCGRITTKDLIPGREVTFPLVDDQSATVILEPQKKSKGTCVTVKTPGVGVLTYSIKCEKCFPIATPYQTKKGERLIVGFIVESADTKDVAKKPKP